MTMIALVLTLLAGVSFPSASETAWMSPAAFHLEIGMPRAEVESIIEKSGWESAPGKYSRQLLIHYTEKKTVTLMFADNELQSVRFELVDFIPSVRTAHTEHLETLKAAKGYDGEAKIDGVFMFDREVPNVMVVVSTKHEDSFGRQGLGFLSVRYFDPAADRLVP